MEKMFKVFNVSGKPSQGYRSIDLYTYSLKQMGYTISTAMCLYLKIETKRVYM